MEIQASSEMAAMANTVSKATFGAEVVTKTLDYMNTKNGFGGTTSADYDFQKSVLSGAYSDHSKFIDKMV